jgi:hypothetical protein
MAVTNTIITIPPKNQSKTVDLISSTRNKTIAVKQRSLEAPGDQSGDYYAVV